MFSPVRGGIENHVHGLMAGLDDRAALHGIVSHTESRTSQEEVFTSTKLTRLARYATLLSTPVCPGIFRELSRSDADLYHLHSPNPFFELAYLATAPRGPLVVTHHSDVIRQRFGNMVYKSLYRRILRRASAIIVSSRAYAEHSEVLGDFLEKVVEIPMGVDADHCGEMCSEVTGTETNPTQGQAPYVLAVGRLVYYKGFEYLIRSMCLHSLPTVIVGNGPLEKKLWSLARSLGVADRLQILSKVDDDALKILLHRCVALILPSTAKSEAFGISQLEAMIHGRPVITTNLPESGVPFVQVQGKTGLLVSPGSAEEIAEAITLLSTRPALATQMGRAGRERVLAHYTTRHVVERTWKVYELVLAGQSLANFERWLKFPPREEEDLLVRSVS